MRKSAAHAQHVRCTHTDGIGGALSIAGEIALLALCIGIVALEGRVSQGLLWVVTAVCASGSCAMAVAFHSRGWGAIPAVAQWVWLAMFFGGSVLLHAALARRFGLPVLSFAPRPTGRVHPFGTTKSAVGREMRGKLAVWLLFIVCLVAIFILPLVLIRSGLLR